LEEHTQRFSAQYLGGKGVKQQKAVVIIPVVVHVVYNTAAQNISDAQIQSQIDVLNADFRKLIFLFNMNNTFDFDDIFADFPLSFPTASPSSDKEFSNLIPTYIDCCHEIFPQK
jgi:hypothetical protein